MASVMWKTPSPYSSIPEDFRAHLVRTTTNETDAYFHATVLQLEWPMIPISTALFGILTVCTGTSLVVLMHRGLNIARLSLLLCILIMYGGTATYWALMLQSYSLDVSSTAASVVASNSNVAATSLLQHYGLRELEPQPASLEFISTSHSDAAMRPQNRQMCAGTAALLVNITLGDAIVWWRAWVICSRKTWVLCLAATLLLGTTAVGITETTQTCTTLRRLQLTMGATTYICSVDGALFLGNVFGFMSSMATLVTNVAATAVIGYQAWVHSRIVRECRLNFLPSRVGVQALLALLVESGVFYCILWALVVAFQIVLTIASSGSVQGLRLVAHLPAHSESAYFWFSKYLIGAALVPLIAIYPTAIIILVTLGNSCFEAAAAHSHAPPGVLSLPLLIQTQPADTQDSESESTTRPSPLAAPVGPGPVDSNSSVKSVLLAARAG